MNMEQKKLVYINIDGFSYSYLEQLLKRGEEGPFRRLLAKGMLFTNLRSGLISITNPMQSAILCGAWSNRTHNFYQHYDWGTGLVVKHKRTFDAENVADVFIKQGKTAVSIHQFMLENNPCQAGEKSCAYITCPQEHSNSFQRFALLDRIVQGLAVVSGGKELTYTEIPDFLALYVDDIDSLGHNNAYEEYPKRSRFEERQQDIQQRLDSIGWELLRFVELCQERELWDQMVILVTTDHGMTPFWGESRLFDLVRRLREAGIQVDTPESRNERTRVVALPYTIELSLYGAPDLTEAERQAVERVCKEAEYVQRVFGKEEMTMQYGMDSRGPDFLLSPCYGSHFYHKDIPAGTFGASHDSFDETSQHIFGLLMGGGVQADISYGKLVTSIDLLPTILAGQFGYSMADSTGRVYTDWF